MLPRLSKSDVDLKKSERPFLKEKRNDISCHAEEENPLFIDNEILRLEDRWINCPKEQSSCNREIANLAEMTKFTDKRCEDLQTKTMRTGLIERNMDMEKIALRVREHSEIEIIDLTSDEEIQSKNSITDSCEIIAGLQVNINTEQRNLREIEIIDLCDGQLHHKNSLNNSCDVVKQTPGDITTKVITKSPIKEDCKKTSKDNCLIEKLSQIVNKLKIPIDKMSVCTGFEWLMSALSVCSSNSPSVIEDKSLNENNLQLNSSHVSPVKGTLLSSSQITEEKNLRLGYSEKEMCKSTRTHRYSKSTGEGSTCLDLKRTKKVKPFLTKLRKSRCRRSVKFVGEVRNAETYEIHSSYEVDEIDGFPIWSFASDTDLGNFSTEQLSRNPSTKSTPNSLMKSIDADEKATHCLYGAIDGLQTKKSVIILHSYPSGAVLPIEVNVTESDEEPSTSSSSIHQDKTSHSVVKKKKMIITDRRRLKPFPKVPTYCRTNKTMARLKIQNKVLRRRLLKALKDKCDW